MSNKIFKPIVALIGSNGHLAKPILNALVDSVYEHDINYPIKVVTRSAKEKQDTPKVKFVEYSLSPSALGEQKSLSQALSGADVIINITGPTVSCSPEIEKAVIDAHPKLYFPAHFGCEFDKMFLFPNLKGRSLNHVKAVRAKGIKTVEVSNGYFELPGSWLYEIGLEFLGINKEAKTVNYVGNPNHRFCYSNLNDIGKVVGVIVTKFKDDGSYKDLPDKVRVYSDIVSQKDCVEFYEKTHGVKLTPTITDDDEVLVQAKEKYKNGPEFKYFPWYIHALMSQGEGKGALWEKDNERELINPGESLFKWTKNIR